MIMKEHTHSRRFLLVEDDDDHAEIVIRSLKKEKTQKSIDRVLDGVEALQYLHGDGSFRGIALPDVILLDLKLPKMDGHEVLAKIKADEKLRRIPVIVLTTSDAEVDKIRAYQLH